MKVGFLLGPVFLCLASCGRELAKPAGAAPAPPEAATFARTTFAAHTRVPIEPGKNMVWCATVQLAWDGIADALGGRLELGKPAPAEDVVEMNRRTFPHGDLASASCVAVGGLVREGVLDRIRAEMTAKFRSEPVPTIIAGPDDAVGWSFLAKDLRFEFPFEDLAEPIRFAGGAKAVRAFGLETDAKGAAAEKALAQILWRMGEVGKAIVNFAEFILLSGEDRLILARMPPPPTLEDAWQAVATVLDSKRSQVLKPDGQNLAIPMIDFDAVHRFEQFVGAPISGRSGGAIREAAQRVRFRLDRTGAVVRSEAESVGYLGMADYTFDVPMLVALLQKGASRPYFLLWVGNDDLLVGASPEPEPDISSLLGSWSWEGKTDRESMTLTVRADRTASIDLTEHSQAHRVEADVQVAGSRPYLVPRSIDGKPANEIQKRRIRMTRSAAGITLVRPWGSGKDLDLTRSK